MIGMGKRSSTTSKCIAATTLLTFLFWFEGNAFADGCLCSTGSESLAVHTSVALACTVTTTPVAFGAYDPLSANSATPLDGTGGLIVTCTDSYSATITLGQGNHPLDGSTDAAPLRQMSDGGINRLPYFLYQDAARTIAWGNTSETAICASGDIPVFGRIPAGQSVPVGEYLDVVVVTVNI